MDDNPDIQRDIVTLREYLESRLEAVAATMAATEKALEVRLAAMNELRDQINTERGRYVQREESNKDHRALEADIRDLRESRALLAGKASMASVFWTGFVSVLSLMIALMSLAVTFLVRS